MTNFPNVTIPYNEDKYVEFNRMIFLNEDTATIQGFCRVTGDPYSLTVHRVDWEEYAKGILPAGDCFPNMSADDLDLVICGTTQKGFRILSGLEN